MRPNARHGRRANSSAAQLFGRPVDAAVGHEVQHAHLLRALLDAHLLVHLILEQALVACDESPVLLRIHPRPHTVGGGAAPLLLVAEPLGVGGEEDIGLELLPDVMRATVVGIDAGIRCGPPSSIIATSGSMASTSRGARPDYENGAGSKATHISSILPF